MDDPETALGSTPPVPDNLSPAPGAMMLDPGAMMLDPGDLVLDPGDPGELVAVPGFGFLPAQVVQTTNRLFQVELQVHYVFLQHICICYWVKGLILCNKKIYIYILENPEQLDDWHNLWCKPFVYMLDPNHQNNHNFFYRIN